MISGAPISGAPISGAGLSSLPVEYRFVGDAAALVWVHLWDAANVEHRWSKVALPDAASYFGGYKDASILEWGSIQRALSDYRGQYEGATFTWLRSDIDRELRTLMAVPATRALTGRSCILRSIAGSARLKKEQPRTIARGIVRDVAPISSLKFRFTAQDYFSAKFQIGSSDVQIPRRTIQRADFPNCPTAAIGQPVPIVYGVLSDASGATIPAPVITGNPAQGYFVEGPYPSAGHGPLTSSASAPGVPTLSLHAGGGAVSTDVPAATYGVIVTSVDASGRESDPAPYYTNQSNEGGRGSFPGTVPQITVDGSSAIRVSWTAAASAAKYRCYLAYYYYGARWTQRIETASTSCEFTQSPSSASPIDGTNITPGAAPITFGQFWHYTVVAVDAGGNESGHSVEVFGYSSPYRRPIRIQWLPVAGATGYRVYRRAAGADYDRVWTVTAPTTVFDDDLLDTNVTIIAGAPVAHGVVPCTYVGEIDDVTGTPWSAFLICGHAMAYIGEWYAGGQRMDPTTAGVSWAIPGKPGFSTYFPNTGTTCQYRDINGRRYTLLYVRGPDAAAAIAGTAPITINGFGIDAWSDSTGPVITSLAQQYLHALQNWLIGDYQSGPWLPSPPMADDPFVTQIDDASFQRLDAIFQARIAGGYPGGFIIGARGERLSMRDLMTRFHLCGIDAGFNGRTQFFVTAPDPHVDLTQTRVFTQAHEIHAQSLELVDDNSQWFNIHPYDLSRDYRESSTTEWRLTGEARDAQAIADYGGEERVAARVQLHMIRSLAVAADIMAMRLRLMAEPPRLVTFDVSLDALDIEPGDIVRVTHLDGVGAQGWLQHPVRVTRHEYDPEHFKVRLEAYDATRILSTVV